MEPKNALTRTTTLSKTTALGLIWSVAEMADGTLVLSDSERHTICTLSLPTSVNVVAGSGYAGFLDGVGDKAYFNTPKGIAVTSEGDVLVADSSNHRLRQVSANGVVTTISGSGKRGGADGPLKSATWDLPVEVAYMTSSDTSVDHRILVASFSSPSLRLICDGIVTTLSSPQLLKQVLPKLASHFLYSPSAQAAPPSSHSNGHSQPTPISASTSYSSFPSSSSSPPSGIARSPSPAPASSSSSSSSSRSISHMGPSTSPSVASTPISSDASGPNGYEPLSMQTPLSGSSASLTSSSNLSTVPSAKLQASALLKLSAANAAALNLLPPEVKSPIFSVVKEIASTSLANTITMMENRLIEGDSMLLDGRLEEACFKSINAIISNHRGDLLIMDCSNHAIRLVTIEGRVFTLSGTGAPGHADGISTHTRLSFPRSMILTKKGEILITDTGNACLRRVELGASLRHLWLPSSPKPVHNLGFLIPTEGSIENQPPPPWSDLTWGTSCAGTWRLHRVILFSRCPTLFDPSIQSKFLDLRISLSGYLAFWEFVYNDIFPISVGDLASAIIYTELVACFACIHHQAGFDYASWILAHSLDALSTVEELLAVVPVLVHLKLVESLKTAIRVLSRRSNDPKAEDAMQQVSAMVSALDDAQFHSWFKRRTSMSASYSKKLGEKAPPSPFGMMERDFASLLVREDSTNKIRFPDLVVKVAVDQLSCHRSIIYKRWPLLAPFIENSTIDKSGAPLAVTLPKELADIRIASLAGLLHFFYTNSLELLKEDECTDLARVFEYLQVDDRRLRAHIFRHGFVDLAASTAPGINLWTQPAEPPASSCSIQ